MQGQQTVIILSVSSDIGFFLAEQYLKLGHRVIGTYRSKGNLTSIEKHPNCRLFNCDVHDHTSVASFVRSVKSLGCQWDVFISCVGYPLPMTAFFKSDFNQWQASVEVNGLDQMRALHALYPLRRKKADVVFFAAGGANNAVVNFSAYTLAKIMLTKMCEFLDAENKDMNIFIVGPGWTKTKVHDMILKAPGVSKAKIAETKKFLKSKTGTPLHDIFECIQWLRSQGRAVASGRNFSVVHDPWRSPQRARLAKELKKDAGMYKLRRHKNDFVHKV